MESARFNIHVFIVISEIGLFPLSYVWLLSGYLKQLLRHGSVKIVSEGKIIQFFSFFHGLVS